MLRIVLSIQQRSCHEFYDHSNIVAQCYQQEDHLKMEGYNKRANTWHTRIAISKQRANWQQHFGNGQSRAPVVFENVQTNVSITIYVAMINTGSEDNLNNRRQSQSNVNFHLYLRWLEGIVFWEVNVQKEYSSLVRRASRPHDSWYPLEHVVTFWSCRAITWWVQAYLSKFLLNPENTGQIHKKCMKKFHTALYEKQTVKVLQKNVSKWWRIDPESVLESSTF